MKRLLAVAFAALALPSAVSGGAPITVFAAASLTEVLPRIDQAPAQHAIQYGIRDGKILLGL